MHYYTHNIGDYRRRTAHLTLLEHGVYRQLLDQYYLNETPFGLDIAEITRNSCARTAAEKKAVESILSEFFIKTDAGYKHSYCDKTIAIYHEKSAKARKSAEVRWNKGCNKSEESERNANAMRTHSEGNANHKPITNNHKPLTKYKPSSIDESLWLDFLSMRKKLKAQNSERALKLILKKASEIQAKGHDLTACFESAIENSWKTIYEPKGAKNEQKLSAIDRVRAANQLSEQQREIDITPYSQTLGENDDDLWS